MKKVLLSLSLVLAVFAVTNLVSRSAKALDTVVVGQPYGYGYGYGGYGYGGYPGPYAGYIPGAARYAGFIPGAVPPIPGPGYYSPNPALQQPLNSAGSPFYLYNQMQRAKAGQRPYFPANPVADYYY